MVAEDIRAPDGHSAGIWERESDMGRPSFSEQGPHFIFQSSFYTLRYA